ncbi:Nn.00g058770.m01.CDS01 [Neocucurbitaria sp. VM-36]
MADHEAEIEAFGSNDDFWLFGYGSLIWKPPPHFDQRLPGYIEGYVRRFWQHSSTEKVWGAAYHIPAAHVASVRSYLDIREINGYTIQFTPFHASSPPSVVTEISSSPPPPPAAQHHPTNSTTPTPSPIPQHQQQPPPKSGIKRSSITSITQEDRKPIKCLVYIGLPSNPQFLGPQDPDALAEKILASRGPSGENREYLYELESALGALSRESGDKHVSDLAGRVRALEGEGEKLKRGGSTEEVEEVQR